MNKMNTPICDFVKRYAEGGTARFHMPGHKGIGPIGVEKYDITEIPGADELYASSGIIRASEENAAKLFGTARTVYSTEGSSLSIRAMLYLSCLHAKENGKKPHILAARNAHKVFTSAAAMLDFDVTWLGSDSLYTASVAICDEAESLIKAMPEPPSAIYVTSPDYLGFCADIKGLSAICKKYGMLLLVDNAHGAYLKFLPESRHPIDLGADMCADSAHKTLPVLTGGAYLHISKNAPEMLVESAERAMAMFGSTSPSYLILESLDAANAVLADGYAERLAHLTEQIAQFKRLLTGADFVFVGDEPTKITLMPKSFGCTGHMLAAKLEERGIFCEFADEDYTVFMLTPSLDKTALSRLYDALLILPRKRRIFIRAPKADIPARAMTVREAMLSPSEEISVREACGRVLADVGVSCPPAIPIAVCGEVIGDAQIKLFEYYGVHTVRVVK